MNPAPMAPGEWCRREGVRGKYAPVCVCVCVCVYVYMYMYIYIYISWSLLCFNRSSVHDFIHRMTCEWRVNAQSLTYQTYARMPIYSLSVALSLSPSLKLALPSLPLSDSLALKKTNSLFSLSFFPLSDSLQVPCSCRSLALTLALSLSS
jgi:hypothetical protein